MSNDLQDDIYRLCEVSRLVLMKMKSSVKSTLYSGDEKGKCLYHPEVGVFSSTTVFVQAQCYLGCQTDAL